MGNQEKFEEQNSSVLKKSELEIQESIIIKSTTQKPISEFHFGSELYTDLADELPLGIYGLRVFCDVSLLEENWLKSNDVPYVVEFANHRFFEILNIDRIAFEKNPGIIHDLIIESDKSEFAKKNVEANLNKTPFIWEGRVLVNDKIVWINFKSIPRLLDNNDILWTGILDDITLRKQNEEEIKHQNAELERLNSNKDFFISVLAHDLRSPFNSILGFLDLLMKNIHSYDIDEIERQIKIVNQSANSTYVLLEDILLWALSQFGKLPFEPIESNLKLFCDEIVDFIKPNAEFKNIAINTVENDEIIVFADSKMFSTIMRNLLSNAIKYSNRGGCVRIYAEQNCTDLIVSVSDNGIGMTAEVQSKLFNFTQMYTSKGTVSENGTGLGMSLCKKFVEIHGGKIWVVSELGKGSVVSFSLPLKNKCQ